MVFFNSFYVFNALFGTTAQYPATSTCRVGTVVREGEKQYAPLSCNKMQMNCSLRCSLQSSPLFNLNHKSFIWEIGFITSRQNKLTLEKLKKKY